MEDNENPNLASSLCKAGCGFFGNQQFDGMCSKCFKDSVKRKQAAPTDSASHSSVSASATIVPTPISVAAAQVTNIQMSSAVAAAAAAVSASAGVPDTTPSVETGRPTIPAISTGDGASADSGASGGEDTDGGADSPTKGKKRSRCFTCNKRVGLTGFECRCGGVYCSIHRYSDKHACEFDYKEHGADHIRKNNPVVVGQKVQKL